MLNVSPFSLPFHTHTLRVRVRSRFMATRIPVMGMFLDAVVVRGHDWRWKNQDGEKMGGAWKWEGLGLGEGMGGAWRKMGWGFGGKQELAWDRLGNGMRGLAWEWEEIDMGMGAWQGNREWEGLGRAWHGNGKSLAGLGIGGGMGGAWHGNRRRLTWE